MLDPRNHPIVARSDDVRRSNLPVRARTNRAEARDVCVAVRVRAGPYRDPPPELRRECRVGLGVGFAGVDAARPRATRTGSLLVDRLRPDVARPGPDSGTGG